MRKQKAAMGAALGLAAVSAMGAAGVYLSGRSSGQVRKMARKAAKRTEKAVMELDRLASRYF